MKDRTEKKKRPRGCAACEVLVKFFDDNSFFKFTLPFQKDTVCRRKRHSAA